MNHCRMQSFTVDPVNMSKSVQSLSRSLQQQTGPHSDLGGCAAGIRPTCFSKYQDHQPLKRQSTVVKSLLGSGHVMNSLLVHLMK